MRATPVTFDTDAGPCLGWFHAAAGSPRGVGLLLCPPLGYEALCAHGAYGQLARVLAGAGFDVLRFDYHGTGDSAGGDADPGRVAAWLASIEAARTELQRLSGARKLGYFGMRLGATLAAVAAQLHGGVRSLVLWAPCATGRAFVREMRAANASHTARNSAGDDGAIEALGSLFSASTLADIGALDAAPGDTPPAPQVLVLARDDLPGEGPLPARYRALGAQVEVATWAGYADMMSEPHETRLTPFALATLLEWLNKAHPRKEAAPRSDVELDWPDGFTMGAVCERPVAFGPRNALVGIVSAPIGPATLAQRAETAVLMLNVGGNYHIGCNRIYVKAARELAADGYQVLRFDVAGIGDSAADAQPGESAYRHQSMGDVSAAMDAMAARGCKRFWLLGICSGAYLAFETALLDARVTGQMLLNSRLLEWDARRNGPWQIFMQQHYKSARYYRKALLRGEAYGRLLRGQVNVRGVAQRLWSLARARIARAVGALRGEVPQHGVLPKMRHLCQRGVDSFVVMSADDDGLDYIEFHLGRRGARMKDHANFRMALIEDSDHTFSTVSSQRAVIDLVRDYLETRHAPSPAPVTVPTRVATT